MTKAPPDVSIIVAVIAGGHRPMHECLTALEPGLASHAVECLVPYDGRLTGVDDLQRRFPWVEFIDVSDRVDHLTFGDSSREHHDILRAIGLGRARGRLVALLEDHGTPAPGWCQAVIDGHAGPWAGVGGAVENGVDRPLNWAVYYCDFGRYQAPVPDGPSAYMSDSNCSYKREVLDSVSNQWRDGFHETLVNWDLSARGHQLHLDPGMTVFQTRRTLRFGPALYERYVWGRSFAGTRCASITASRRVMLAALSFLLPPVLTWRVFARAIGKPHKGKLLTALPLVLLLQVFWAIGELTGYMTGRAAPDPR